MAEKNYYAEAYDDAKDTVEEFLETIIESLIDNEEVSDDLFNDYPNGDSYHHETHTDRSYSLLEAAKLLDALGDYEETDSGLWEGQEPRDAVATQAAFTYGNAVLSMWQDYIKEINDVASQVVDEFNEKKSELEEKIEELEAEEEGEDWTEGKAAELKSLRGQLDSHDRRLKRELERTVLETIGRKPKRPQGPREWSP
jgi:DNA-binding transcriptional MerR regulator